MIDEKLRGDLLAAQERDASTRTRLAATGALFDGYNAEMEAVHLENAALLEPVLDAHGWPDAALVGEDGVRAAFVILQHAISRPDLQRRGLALLDAAAANGAPLALEVAMLSDRVAMFEGRPQYFGTQFDWDENGEMSPAPIRDLAHVDERRAAIGLPPLAENIAEIRAGMANARPPPDAAARRTEVEAWARRVGWRA